MTLRISSGGDPIFSVGFTPEYVESISPVERKLYWSYYENLKKKQEEDKNSRSNSSRMLG